MDLAHSLPRKDYSSPRGGNIPGQGLSRNQNSTQIVHMKKLERKDSQKAKV